SSGLDHSRILDELADKRQFSFIYKEMCVLLESVARHLKISQLLLRLTENGVAASRSILHVENRIVLRLLSDFLEIEVQRRVTFAVKHHEADRITTHFVDHITQRDEFASALRHADGFSATEELHQLAEQYG